LSRSPFGRTLVAMRENPTRASLIGINVRSRRIVALSMSGGLGGLAGGLLVFTTGLISPAAMAWTRSGDFLLVALIGGLGTILGPFLAGVGWVFVRDWVMSQVDYWEIPFGLLVIAVVLFFPGGVAAIGRRLFLARGRAPS
ncbi:MAG: branched-chain amino acid ABC transporter permease, partial [Solirubrobacterales bacterium]|nr:branched-chain amino acid ABC transporter permease [Solirubrobacterales bacterium]